MIHGAPSVLTWMVDLVAASLWLVLGLVAFMWPAWADGLLRSAAELVFPRTKRTKLCSGSDASFLRSVHSRP